jgi:hypothetical protein
MPTPRELALAQPDLKPVPVDVPEWGPDARVWVKPLDGFELARFFAGGGGDNALKDLVRLAVFTLVNEDGSPVFTEEDMPALRAKPQGPFVRIAGEAIQLNRLGGVDEEKKDSPSAPANSGNGGSAVRSGRRSPNSGR